MKKRAILFVLIVCAVTVYGILSADHYFQINSLEKQLELAAGRIQNAQIACREADNILLDYYLDYTQQSAETVSLQTAGSPAEDTVTDAEAILDALNSFNIQDTRYQEIQLQVINSKQSLDSAVNQYNDLTEDFNKLIASPLFFPISNLLGYESAAPFETDC